jgi:REP element-mobilizing transposase RayT
MTFPSLHIPGHLYLVTASVCGWKRLFVRRPYTDIALNSLDWLRKQGRMALFAFVLMPSHLHAIVQPKDRVIGHLVKDFGSYTAHEILKQLRYDQEADLMQFFRE